MKKLENATQGLEKCLENVLHEDELRFRATSMTEAHYESLKLQFVQTAENSGSAMLHWLQLTVNSANQASQGGNELDHRELKIDLIFLNLFFLVIRTLTEVVGEQEPISSHDSNFREMTGPLQCDHRLFSRSFVLCSSFTLSIPNSWEV